MWLHNDMASNNKTSNIKIRSRIMGSIKDAYNCLEGVKIVKIREMTTKEAIAE